MTPAEIQGYIAIVAALYSLGVSVGGKVRDLIKLFHPDAVLTEEQINAIEAAGMAESQRRMHERLAMGRTAILAMGDGTGET